MAKRATTPRQPAPAFGHLTARDVARLWGVTHQAVGLWAKRGCPRHKDATYDLAAVIAWRESEAAARAADSTAAGSVMDWKKKQDEERARTLELKRRQIEGDLWSADAVEDEFEALASIIRGAGDRLQKRHGVEAYAILEEALDTYEGRVQRLRKKAANA